jgi:hypothetical protein
VIQGPVFWRHVLKFHIIPFRNAPVAMGNFARAAFKARRKGIAKKFVFAVGA